MAVSYASIAWKSGTPEINQHVRFNFSYNGRDASTRTASQPLDRDLTGTVSRRFITPHAWPNLERPSTI